MGGLRLPSGPARPVRFGALQAARDAGEAGYVATERRLTGRRHTVRARLTDTGRTAFEQHVLALQEIVAGAAARQ
ncbi:transcriptional regulator [Gordonia alkaliphila]|nr:transcriptional regulator [Gordonia alkaliphila]